MFEVTGRTQMAAVLRIRSAAVAVSKAYHTSGVVPAGQQWRLRHGKSRSGTEYGPLTDLPDWSYADGRPAPHGKGHTRRTRTQHTINERIWRLIGEMDQAKLDSAEAVSTCTDTELTEDLSKQ